MSITLLFTIALAGTPAQADVTAGAQLTAALAGADSIDAVTTQDAVVELDLVRAHEAFRVLATTENDKIVAVQMIDVGPAPHAHGGKLSWLARELVSAQVSTLEIARDGSVRLGTSAGADYALIAATGGNAAVSARWAAAWDVGNDE